jgi:glycosyltransferase involved in cell wall biosynthesis
MLCLRSESGPVPISFGFLSPYPPSPYRVAEFTAALMQSLTANAPGDTVGVVRVVRTQIASKALEVVAHLHTQSPHPSPAAVKALNEFDVVIVQYAFEAFDGSEDLQLLALMNEVRTPIITVVHSVPAVPTPREQQILDRLCADSAAVVTVSRTARDRILEQYHVDPAKVAVIPHGAAVSDCRVRRPAGARPLILTWGVDRHPEGVQWAIAALRSLLDLHPRPAYILAWRPTSQRRQNLALRESLYQHARAYGVAESVRLVECDPDEKTLDRLLSRADLVLLPYQSDTGVIVDVLVRAIASGTPVVATAVAHAEELLGSGAGLLVPLDDHRAMGAAVRHVLTTPDTVRRMAEEARRLTRSLDWSNVAALYRGLATDVLERHGHSSGAHALSQDMDVCVRCTLRS